MSCNEYEISDKGRNYESNSPIKDNYICVVVLYYVLSIFSSNLWEFQNRVNETCYLKCEKNHCFKFN